MKDYKLTNVHLFSEKRGTQTVVYAVGTLLIDIPEEMKASTDPKVRREVLRLRAANGKNPAKLTIFPNQVKMEDGEFITRLAQLLPKEGKWKDENGDELSWNGTIPTPEGKSAGWFSHEDYMKAMEQLYWEGFLFQPDGEFVEIPTSQPLVQLYSRNMGHVQDESGKFTDEVLHKKGDVVCYKGTNEVRVFNALKIFVRYDEKGPTLETSTFISGFSPSEQLKNAENMYKPLSWLLAEQKAGRLTDFHVPEAVKPMVVDVETGEIKDPDEAEDVPET